MPFSFDKDQFNRLFPFFILVDKDMKIIDYGKSLKKIFPDLENKYFSDCFKFLRPQHINLTFNNLISFQNQLLIFGSKENPVFNFKGGFEFIEDKQELLFLGSPWFNSIEDANSLHLTITDFAIHDTVMELLHVLKTQEITNNDIKKLLKTLNNQRNELKRLSLIAEETINGVVVTDAQVKIQWVNKSFTKITGYTLEEVIGKKPGSFLQGNATNPETVKYLRTQINNKLPFECEILNYNKSGSPYWIRFSGQPLFDNEGNVVQFFALEEDITDRKNAEKKLKEAEERWEFALEGAGDGVWEFDFQTGETYFSKEYKKMLGYADNEFLNEVYEWTSRIHPDDFHIIEETDKEYEEEKITNHSREYRIKNKQGKYIWVLDRGMIISRTADGKPLRMIGTHTNITERKITALALERNEKQLRTISENIPGVVYEYGFNKDGSHGFRFVSTAIERIFGITIAESANLMKFVHPYDQKILTEKIVNSEKNNESFNYEGRFITPKGIMWSSINASFSYENSDGCRIFNGIIMDITEKKLAEKKLEEQRKFYEDVLNEIPADIAVFDKNHTYLFLNPIAIKNPEIRQWLIGKKDEDYCRERNKPLSVFESRRAVFNDVINSKKLKSWEEKLTTPDGIEEYHLRYMYPVLDEKGEIKTVIGYGLNITKQKQIEQQFLLNEKRYRDLFNYSQALICTHDLNGVLLSVNPAICESLGYSSEELIGKNLAEFIPEKNKPLFKPEYLDKINGEEKAKGLFTVVHKSGKKLFLLFQNYQVKEAGAEPYVIGFSQDITDRINAEQELMLAKKLTEEASKAKEIFLANMSHEIRTPMTGILGVANLIAKTTLNEQQKNYIKLITESANNLLVIVNDVLDIEKIASGKFEFESVHFKIAEKAATTIQSFQYKAEEKGIQLFFKNNIPAQMVLEGDPYRLSQILNNLLSNALKFTPNGEITISSSVIEQKENKALVEFIVSDTGVGINEEKIKSIFDPFVQASTDIARKYGGTGLGLSICKNLVEMQGGTIEVQSVSGQGTNFRFTIPYKTGSPQQLKEDVKIEMTFKNNAKKKILIAEDVELNQYLAKHILEDWGISTDIANNGKEALDKVTLYHYDLILMDIQMPEMDGIAATRAIRKLSDPIKSSIPIIALTANALKGDDQKYLNAGMNDYITKPYTEERLYKVIRKFFSTENEPDTTLSNINNKEMENQNHERLYDLSMVNVIGRNNPVFVEKMVKLFLDNITIDLNKLKDAEAQKDRKGINFYAHKMKSTIESMGINDLKTIIRALEMKEAIITDEQIIHEYVSKIDSVLQTVITQMKTDFPQFA